MHRRSFIGSLACAANGFAFSGGAQFADVYVGGRDGYHTYRIPALAVTKKRTVLAICEARKNNGRDSGDIDLVVKRSTDHGVTWSPQRILHEEGGEAEITIGNPCAVVDRHSIVHVVFTRNNQRIFCTRSIDDGVSFSAPVEITDALRRFPFPWTRVGAGPGHGIETRSGRIVIPVWLNERIRFNYRSAVIYSDNGGKSWRAGGLAGPEIADTNECMVVERSDRALALNMRAQGSHKRSEAISRDGGETWSAPRYVDALIDPVCQGSILGFSRGRKYQMLFANPASASSRTNLTMRWSGDDGRTWPVAKALHEGSSGYSDLALAGDGRILCLYEAGEKRSTEKLMCARFGLDWLAS